MTSRYFIPAARAIYQSFLTAIAVRFHVLAQGSVVASYIRTFDDSFGTALAMVACMFQSPFPYAARIATMHSQISGKCTKTDVQVQ